MSKPFSEMTAEEQGELGLQLMINFMQSCPGKTAMSGVSGFLLGGFFGLFMASMLYDVPVGAATGGAGGVAGGAVKHISDLPLKQQMKLQFSDMGRRSWSSAKNFGFIGLIFSGVECCVESLRLKNDIYNGVVAGCITGGGLAISGGPQLLLVGCAGFALFSTLIDLYMRSDHLKPPVNDYDE